MEDNLLKKIMPHNLEAEQSVVGSMLMNNDTIETAAEILTGEDFYAKQGLTLTDAFNVFIQQSLNENGLPFLPSEGNEELMKAKAMRRLLAEAQKGWDSAERDGWVSEEDAYRILGIEP